MSFIYEYMNYKRFCAISKTRLDYLVETGINLLEKKWEITFRI